LIGTKYRINEFKKMFPRVSRVTCVQQAMILICITDYVNRQKLEQSAIKISK
jgi:hypothetical protein